MYKNKQTKNPHRTRQGPPTAIPRVKCDCENDIDVYTYICINNIFTTINERESLQ